MCAAERSFGAWQAFLPHLREPCLEVRIVDAGIFFVCRAFRADEGGDAGGGGEDLGCTGHVADFCKSEDAFEDMASVKCTRCVFDATFTVHRIGVDHASVFISGHGDEAGHVFELGAEKLEIEAACPGLNREEEGWEHGSGFELRTVAVAVEVLKLVDDGGEYPTFPWTNFFCEGRTRDKR